MQSPRLLLASFLVTLLGATSCGSSKSGFGGDGGSQGSGSSGSGSGGSSGASGLVLIEQTVDNNSGMLTYNGTFSAGFASTSAALQESGCDAPETMGDCQVQVCESADAGMFTASGNQSAGTVGLSGTEMPFTLTANFDDSYSPGTESSTGVPSFPPIRLSCSQDREGRFRRSTPRCRSAAPRSPRLLLAASS